MNTNKRSVGAVLRIGALVAATALMLSGCSGREAPQTSEDASSPITIGVSWPQSGPLGAVAPGLQGFQAYIQEVNESGGVNGHEIKVVTADDAYDPAKLVDNYRKFVEQDNAVLIANFGSIAAPNRDYLKQKNVAGISLARDEAFADVETYPLHRAFWPDLVSEGRAQAEWLKTNRPDATIGLIGYNNDHTDSLLDGFSAAGVEIDKVARVAPGTADLSAQVSEFEAAGVDVLLTGSVGAPTVGAIPSYAHQIGWAPTTFLASTTSDYATAINQATPEAVKGAFSFQFLKDPADPQWADDPGIIAFKGAMDAAGFGNEADNAMALNGYGLGAAVVSALNAADSLTGEGIIKAWDSFDKVENPILWPGITFTSGPGGHILFQYILTQFDGTSWIAEGDIIDAAAEGWMD